jgi:uncharacterized protein (DUF433 family)
MKFDRITIDPRTCAGKPCIRGFRLPVSRILALLAGGMTRDSLLSEFPFLEPADISEALHYAAYLADARTVELAE